MDDDDDEDDEDDEDEAEERAWMQFPRAERDWLIFLASSRVFPVAPVLLTFSLPARSARFNLPSFVLPSGSLWIKEMIKSEWLRELAAFIFVKALDRNFSPSARRSRISS